MQRLSWAVSAGALALALALAAPAGARPPAGPACADGADGGEWPSYGGGPAGTRSQPAENRIGPANAARLTEAWRFEIHSDDPDARFFNTPVVADGCVYAAPSDGKVAALNADSGETVWETRLPYSRGYSHINGNGGLIGSVAVDQRRNRVYALVTELGAPYVAALDQRTGNVLWRTRVTDEPGTYFLSSAVVHENTVIASFGGDSTVPDYRGGVGFVDARTGRHLGTTYVISDEDRDRGYQGASFWATGAVDPGSDSFFLGSGNPGAGSAEHEHSNAILKFDVDRKSKRFGEIVDAYKGDVDSYVEGADRQPVCEHVPKQELPYPANGLPCAQLDLDFGASVNLFRDARGKLLVGELQKSGTYHAAYAGTMQRAWTATVGPPCFFCSASSSAVAGGKVFSLGTPVGQLAALRADDGALQWAAPVGSVVHYQSVSTANGVVYTFDGRVLHAWDAATGLNLLAIPLETEARPPALPADGDLSHMAVANFLTANSSGIAIARNTLYVATLDEIVALRLPDGG